MSATLHPLSQARVEPTRRLPQLVVLAAMLLLYALSAALYIVIPGGMLDPRAYQGLGITPPAVTMPVWQLVLGNVAMILVGYSLLGLAGYCLSQRASLPGIYRPDAGWRGWVWRPLALGVGAGMALVAADLTAQRLTGYAGFAHPPFPASILASLSAGIGEEILTRLLVLSLWAVILTWLLRRPRPDNSLRRPALWIANMIAALAFAASHLPGIMLIAGVTTPAALPPVLLAEVFLFNGLIGLIAGEAYIRTGLVAASGVHFWCDVVWHVVYGLFR